MRNGLRSACSTGSGTEPSTCGEPRSGSRSPDGRSRPPCFPVSMRSTAASHLREYDIKFTGEAGPPLGTSPGDAELINSIAWLMNNKLDLPFPAVTKAYVYVNEATLVDGLVTLGGEKSAEAWDRWRNASGVATRNGIFLRGDHMAWMHLQGRAGLLAHELAHVSQRELG